MPRATKLSDIGITHISLVKAGANGKSIIYKSADGEPSYNRTIEIKKSDDEKGIVYGIVYAPEEVDTDCEYTTADEIEKAAYGFMKARNTLNVDKQHSFEVEKAFVAESWIIKEGDPTFPDEQPGTWAVAIKLEDEELQKAAKNGEIAGISMAGTAAKEEGDLEVEKAEGKNFSFDDVIELFKRVFSSTNMEIRGCSYNDNVEKKEKENGLTEEQLAKIVSESVAPLVKELSEQKSKLESLEKKYEETQVELKKSRQNDTPPAGGVEKEDDTKGIL